MNSVIHPIKIFAGTKSRYMGEEICKCLGMELGKMNIQHFADGEFEVSFEEPIRGCEVYLVQSTFPNTDNLMELLLMIDAAKRASAHSIIAVMPYFGWARQDRKDKPRVSIAAKLVADLLMAAGVNRVITMDLHAAQIQGFFDIPVDNMHGNIMFTRYYLNKFPANHEDMVVVSPDVGSVARSRAFANKMGMGLAIVDKRREKANQCEVMNVIGDVAGKECILYDDMVDTAGSLCNAAKAIYDKGATKVYACATHAVLSGPAIERIENSVIEEMVFLNTIPAPAGLKSEKIKFLDVAPMFAEAIQRTYDEVSLSQMF